MIDIDDFKKYNDTHGHVQGDVALQRIGSVLQDVCSPFGIVCRYGGEEFAVLLPSMPAEEAERLGVNLKTEIAKVEIYGRECFPNGRVTVSLGIAEHPKMGATFADILWRADEALYQAKSLGKNQVVVFGSPRSQL